MPKIWISKRQEAFLDMFIDSFENSVGLELTYGEAINFFFSENGNREAVKKCIEKAKVGVIFGSGKEGLQ